MADTNLDIIGHFGVPVIFSEGREDGKRIEIRASRTVVVKREDCARVARFFDSELVDRVGLLGSTMDSMHFEAKPNEDIVATAIRHLGNWNKHITQEQGEEK